MTALNKNSQSWEKATLRALQCSGGHRMDAGCPGKLVRGAGGGEAGHLTWLPHTKRLTAQGSLLQGCLQQRSRGKGTLEPPGLVQGRSDSQQEPATQSRSMGSLSARPIAMSGIK